MSTNNKKYYLYSNIQTCPPCRTLKNNLDLMFPEWKDHIEYRDINSLDQESLQHISKINVRSLPSFTDEDNIIFVGYSPEKLKQIIELCTQA